MVQASGDGASKALSATIRAYTGRDRCGKHSADLHGARGALSVRCRLRWSGRCLGSRVRSGGEGGSRQGSCLVSCFGSLCSLSLCSQLSLPAQCTCRRQQPGRSSGQGFELDLGTSSQGPETTAAQHSHNAHACGPASAWWTMESVRTGLTLQPRGSEPIPTVSQRPVSRPAGYAGHQLCLCSDTCWWPDL